MTSFMLSVYVDTCRGRIIRLLTTRRMRFQSGPSLKPERRTTYDVDITRKGFRMCPLLCPLITDGFPHHKGPVMRSFCVFFVVRPFVWGINRSLVNSPHKGQWCGALVFSLICAWKKNKANLRDLIAATGLVIKLDSNRQFFHPCDREIWWMTSKNNRTLLLYCVKLCASFQIYWWIQTGFTVQKRSIRVEIGDMLSRVTLKFDGWPWKTTGHLFYATSSFVQHFVAIGLVNSNWSYSPEMPNLGQIRRFLELCDLEIWRMTLQNNRAPLLCYFKLYASFRTHWWIQI